MFNSFLDVPVPAACVILIGLFVLQPCGTHKIGFMFAPIIAVWLLFIGAVGVYNIIFWDVEILYKISPLYLFKFMRNLDVSRWRLLGSAILCAAGWTSSISTVFYKQKKDHQLILRAVLTCCRIRGNVCRVRPFFQEINQGIGMHNLFHNSILFVCN